MNPIGFVRSLLKPRELSLLSGEIVDEAKLTWSFVFLSFFACLIATLGLHLNSAGVIIGAMVIAPLMLPILGLSLQLIYKDLRKTSEALLCLIAGTILGIAISYVISSLINNPEPTSEILARTNPNLLDLGVAIFAGATAAYVRADKKLSQSIAGVAIAVALMPPLCVVGYELAHHNYVAANGAMLLYFTNLNGILVSACLTFIFLGYHRFTKTINWILVAMVLTMILAFPLSMSMRDFKRAADLKQIVTEKLKDHKKAFAHADLMNLKITRYGDETRVLLIVRKSADGEAITSKAVHNLEKYLESKVDYGLTLEVEVIPSYLIK